MSDEKVLTKEIAEQFLADEDSVDLSEFTAIEDEAAEVLVKSNSTLWLTGITHVNRFQALKLGEHKRPVQLRDITTDPETAHFISECSAIRCNRLTSRTRSARRSALPARKVNCWVTTYWF